MKNVKTEFIKRFEKFLKENCKNEFFNIKAYIDDLITQWSNSGCLIYELSKFESKDGLPHEFYYDTDELNSLMI